MLRVVLEITGGGDGREGLVSREERERSRPVRRGRVGREYEVGKRVGVVLGIKKGGPGE